ncbi:MAG: hypothetical protein Q4C45_01215 [Oscillospiraceae bacterium]|nr:hypothetical protein [Oscillospiraceae bacterium]
MTDRQEEYLLLFAELSSKKGCITNASEVLGVTKATASHLSSALVRKGYIRKGPGGEVELTEFGSVHVAPKLKQVKKLEKWLESGIGLAPNLAESEARRMVAVLHEETIEEIVQFWCNDQDVLSINRADSFFNTLDVGIYQVPFQIRKKDEQKLSMGDRGFRKPALLVRRAGRCFFLLYPLEIQYRVAKQKSRINKGTIKRLWYRADGLWYETQPREDGSYLLPASAVHCQRETDGFTAHLRIRVRTTVSLLKMPESEADVVFHLEELTASANLQE